MRPQFLPGHVSFAAVFLFRSFASVPLSVHVSFAAVLQFRSFASVSEISEYQSFRLLNQITKPAARHPRGSTTVSSTPRSTTLDWGTIR